MIMAWSSWQSYQSILRRERSQKDLYSRHILPWGYWHLMWNVHWPSCQTLITVEHILNDHHWVRHKWLLVLLTILSLGQLVKAPINLSLSRSNEQSCGFVFAAQRLLWCEGWSGSWFQSPGSRDSVSHSCVGRHYWLQVGASLEEITTKTSARSLMW